MNQVKSSQVIYVHRDVGFLVLVQLCQCSLATGGWKVIRFISLLESVPCLHFFTWSVVVFLRRPYCRLNVIDLYIKLAGSIRHANCSTVTKPFVYIFR